MRKDQEYTKVCKDNQTRLKQFKQQQDERNMSNNRTIKLREQEYKEEYARAEQTTKLDCQELAKTKEYRALKYKDEIEQLKKNHALQTENVQ